jgi:hypothetical protein
MDRKKLGIVVAAGASALVALAGHPAAAAGLPASVVSYTPDLTESGTFSTVDYSTPGGTAGTTDWRIVTGTGNGAEHWVTTTSLGQLLDLGGRYINMSSDLGHSWTSVQPPYPLANAEGALATAPNGDILGATWDPYSGDHLITYKYDAASKQWTYLEDPLHTPFYDRPEVNVIPGPLTISGTTYPYISTVSSHGSPIFYSTDGLTYDNVIQDGAAVTEWVPTHPSPVLDWSQGQDWAPLRALGNGYALGVIAYGGGAEDFSPADLTSTVNVFDPTDLSFHPLTLPDNSALPVNLQVDSRGWLHGVTMRTTGFDYKTSTDGGKTWQTLAVNFPGNDRLNSNTGGEVIDLRVNAELGTAAVVTRTDHGTTSPGVAGDPEQDWVYKIDISSSTPKPLRRYMLGLGNSTSDTQYHPTYETQGHRYDFASIALIPAPVPINSGGLSAGDRALVVATMMDESTVSGFPTTGVKIVASALAFEQSSSFGNQPNVPEAPTLPFLVGAGVAGALSVAALRVRRRGRSASSSLV